MRIKPGVNLDGVHWMLWYACVAADYYRQAMGFGEATVTGGRENADRYGVGRVAGTFHPSGRAVDLRTTDLPGGSLGEQARQYATWLSSALGPTCDVVLEGDHIHVELQRPPMFT